MELAFRESDEFFGHLDRAVERGDDVVIVFDLDRPGQDSKLWPRLRKTKNWTDVEAAFADVSRGGRSPWAAIMAPQMVGAVATGTLVLAAWIATLIAALFAYGIYSNRLMVLEVHKIPPVIVLKAD